MIGILIFEVLFLIVEKNFQAYDKLVIICRTENVSKPVLKLNSDWLFFNIQFEYRTENKFSLSATLKKSQFEYRMLIFFQSKGCLEPVLKLNFKLNGEAKFTTSSPYFVRDLSSYLHSMKLMLKIEKHQFSPKAKKKIFFIFEECINTLTVI